MKFYGNLVKLSIDEKKFRKAVHEELSNELGRLAFVWLEAVLAEIPTWSGASRATFLRLAREIGYSLVISPEVVSRISFGQRHGTGKVTMNAKKGIYTFKYTTNLRWLVHNESNSPGSDPNVFHRLRKPGPYNFQQKGLAAFLREAVTIRLPLSSKFLKKTNLRI